MSARLQDANPTQVAAWTKQIDHKQLRDQAWLIIADRYPGLAKGIAPYILEHYTEPGERQAAFDGLTLALLTISRHEDMSDLANLFEQPAGEEPTTPQYSLKATND